MNLKNIIYLILFLSLFSCKKNVKIRSISNPNLTYTYSDNLREDVYKLIIKGNRFNIIVSQKNGETDIQEYKIKRMIELIDEDYDENSQLVAKYILDIENLDHMMISEYVDKVEIKTEGLIEKYDDPNIESNYKWSAQTILAIKIKP